MSSSSKVVLAAMICAIVVATTTTTMAQESPDDYVNAHNTAREAVGVGPVSWNDTLEAYAEDYAKNLIADCKVIRSGGPYGENIFFGDAGEDWTAQKAVDSWVDEKQYYDYDTNTCASGKECGEYTQVVWADSTSIGCALVVCDDDGGVIIICNYYPPGDVEGEKPYFLG